MDLGLAGKIALVTGSAGGIGSEIVRALSAEGVRVAIHYRSSEKAAKKLADEIESPLLLKGDLTQETEVERIFDNIEKNLGPLELFIANAGIWETKATPITEMSLQQWNHTLSSNLTSVFLGMRRFFQGIKKNRLTDPAAVIMGSTAGLWGEADHSDYAASKSALTGGFLLSLKNEIARLSLHGRVNAISPGWVLTPMVGELDKNETFLQKTLQTVSLRKIARPNDLASLVTFLCSSKVAGHITGQNMVVAGGMEGRILYEPEEIDLKNV